MQLISTIVAAILLAAAILTGVGYYAYSHLQPATVAPAAVATHHRPRAVAHHRHTKKVARRHWIPAKKQTAGKSCR